MVAGAGSAVAVAEPETDVEAVVVAESEPDVVAAVVAEPEPDVVAAVVTEPSPDVVAAVVAEPEPNVGAAVVESAVVPGATMQCSTLQLRSTCNNGDILSQTSTTRVVNQISTLPTTKAIESSSTGTCTHTFRALVTT